MERPTTNGDGFVKCPISALYEFIEFVEFIGLIEFVGERG